MKTFVLLIGCLIAINTAAQQNDQIEDTLVRWESLTDMCIKYPTDKCPDGHNFIELYEDLFSPMRDTMGKFFEIGIRSGISHLLWREYFPTAEIFGIDILDFSKQSEGSGITTFVADQSNREDLQAFIDKCGTGYDVILDDGGHAMHHQQVSLGFLFEHLNPGGYYLIEDVHTSLPTYYPGEEFNVNESETNTTLYMIEWFMRTDRLISEFMTDKEMTYLQEHIDTIELSYFRTPHHSMICVIRKK
ncbi:MAG: SAM-dependent methyltransferase [Flavobacteriaceae bacterium]|jgi:SAM-dependent methyltransferase